MAEPAALEQIVKLALERVLAREQRCVPGAAAGDKNLQVSHQSIQKANISVQPPEFVKVHSGPRGEIVLASDHGGFELKSHLFQYLRECGYPVRDLGTHSTEAVDYPDFALKVAAAVAKGDAWRGIMVDGVGVGSAMAAGKVPGIRAATCFDVFSTRNAREHNDANVLCLGGRVLEPAKAREMARIFLDTDFGGDRHAKRVAKIVAIERLFLGAAAGRAP